MPIDGADVEDLVVVQTQDRCPGDLEGRDEGPGLEVVDSDPVARGHVQPVAQPGVGIGQGITRAVGVVRVSGAAGDDSRLYDGVFDVHSQVARGGDLVVGKENEPARNRVFGQVGVGPLVDGVRDVVSPVLQELGRGPGVVDLVEMHLERLAQAIDAQRQSDHDEEGDEPDVHLVESAPRLGIQRGRSIRRCRALVDAAPQPHHARRHVLRLLANVGIGKAFVEFIEVVDGAPGQAQIVVCRR